MLSKLNLKNKLSFLQSSKLRGIIANTGWLFADRILRMGVGLFVWVWVARYLGVQQFGVFNYATAFVALFSTLSTLGLDAIVVRSIVREPEKRSQILGTAFWLKLFGGVAALLLAVSCIILVRHDDQLTISLVAILSSVGIFQAFDTIDLWYQSQVQSKYTVIAKNTAFVILAIFKVILIKLHAPLLAFAWATFAEIVIGAVGLILSYKLQGYSLRLWTWSLPLAKKLLKESWFLILSGLSVMIYLKIDLVMLGSMIGDKAVGIYSSATRIIEIWYFIPGVLVSSISPSIYEAKKECNESLYHHRILKLLRIFILCGMAIAVLTTLLSRTMITLVFGTEFSDASSMLAILSWGSMFAFMGSASAIWYTAEGLNNILLRCTLIGATINILLNLILIPHFQGDGAAIATVISHFIGGFVANSINIKSRTIFLIQLKSLIFID